MTIAQDVHSKVRLRYVIPYCTR